VDNKFYNQTRSGLDKTLKLSNATLEDIIGIAEEYYSINNPDALEDLFIKEIVNGFRWSIALRAHLIIDRHCE